ncbi:MAG: cupin domain-containing protein [Nevskia sp.]|nr:cupin domain-containing protein [Nevskia sp.]
MTTRDWIGELRLEPHPEGGYFRRIYTSARPYAAPQGERALATSIYYLLDCARPRGCLHRNRSDILHFLIDGGPVEYLLLPAGGELRRQRLDASAGKERFLAVAGGCWKASQLVDGAGHALIAEVVTPGFDYADHQFATEEDLRREHPQHLAVLREFIIAR